jgi:hypothetical protein
MAWDGNGNFIRLYSWVSDKTNGINPSSSRFDNEDNGFATAGFGNCITRDGQGKASASQIPGTDAAYDLGAVAQRWNNGFFAGNVTVGGNATVGGNLAVTGSLTLGGQAQGLVLGNGTASLSAANILPGQTYVAWNSATNSRASTTSQVIDPVLQLTAIPAGTYSLSGAAQFLAGSTSSGIEATFGNSSGTVGTSTICLTLWNSIGTVTPYSGQFLPGTGAIAIAGGSYLHYTLTLNGAFTVTAAAAIGFYWAQDVSNASALVMQIGSTLGLTRLA